MKLDDFKEAIEKWMLVPDDKTVNPAPTEYAHPFQLTFAPLVFKRGEGEEYQKGQELILNLYALVYKCPFKFHCLVDSGASIYPLLCLKNYGLKFPSDLDELFSFLDKNREKIYENIKKAKPSLSIPPIANYPLTRNNSYEIDIDICTSIEGIRKITETRNGYRAEIPSESMDDIREIINEHNAMHEDEQDEEDLHYRIREILTDEIERQIRDGMIETEFCEESQWDSEYESEELEEDNTDYEEVISNIIDELS